jgi:hypothetical protein
MLVASPAQIEFPAFTRIAVERLSSSPLTWLPFYDVLGGHLDSVDYNPYQPEPHLALL